MCAFFVLFELREYYGRLPYALRILTGSFLSLVLIGWMVLAVENRPEEPFRLSIRSVRTAAGGTQSAPNLVLPKEYDGLTIVTDVRDIVGATDSGEPVEEEVVVETGPRPPVPSDIDPSTGRIESSEPRVPSTPTNIRLLATPEESSEESGPPPGSLGLLGVGR